MFNFSEKAAHDHLSALEKKKYINRVAGKPRAISIPGRQIKEVPIVGRVAAGTPLLASENIQKAHSRSRCAWWITTSVSPCASSDPVCSMLASWKAITLSSENSPTLNLATLSSHSSKRKQPSNASLLMASWCACSRKAQFPGTGERARLDRARTEHR